MTVTKSQKDTVTTRKGDQEVSFTKKNQTLMASTLGDGWEAGISSGHQHRHCLDTTPSAELLRSKETVVTCKDALMRTSVSPFQR